MSSKFWGGADDDDEDDYSSDSQSGDDSQDDDDQSQQKNTKSSYFLRGGDDSDDSDDDKRVVRTQKEKRFDELKATIEAIRGALKNNDWDATNNEYDKFLKQADKAKVVLAQHGVPRFFVRILVEMEDAHNNTDKKKLSKINAKAYAIMKQKLAKANKPYQESIKKFRDAPPEGDEDDDDESEPVIKKPVVESSDTKKDDKVEWTRDVVEVKLGEVIAQRGKKGQEKHEQIRKLIELLSHAEGVDQELRIWFHILSAIFDTTTLTTQMTRHNWTQALRSLNTILAILFENQQIVLHEMTSATPADFITDKNSASVYVLGTLLSAASRLDDELTQSLQLIDSHTEQYVSRLKDETKIVRLLELVEGYYARVGDKKSAAQAAVLRMSHLYYKREWVHKKLFDAEQYRLAHPELEKSEASDASDHKEHLRASAAPARDGGEEDDDNEDDEEDTGPSPVVNESRTTIVPARDPPPAALGRPYIESKEILHELAVLVFNHGDERLRTRAMLYLIFHHALHDRFFEARDLLLISHLQDTIHHTDIPTQIQFNRVMVQLGLCAFRTGLIHDAHNCLSDICSGGKIKELLAQGTSSRYTEKSPEQERLEKIRQIPTHMHINLDLVECAHLISAMLLEVPNMAAHAYDVKRKVISRPFRKLLDYFDRQVFSGPPENTRESVVAAARALSKGDWRMASNYLFALRVWRFMADSDQIKEMLTLKLKEEGLRTFLFSYGAFYASLSLTELATTFELSERLIHGIVSKMMINDELRASWDQSTTVILLHNVEPTRLQSLALQYAEKLNTFVDSNERALDNRFGGGNYKYDSKPSKDRWQDSRFNRRGYQQRSGDRRGDRNDRNDRGDRNDRRGGDRGDRSGDRRDNRSNRGRGGSSSGGGGSRNQRYQNQNQR